MHNIYVKDLLKICKSELISGNPDMILENFSKDTRTIKENDIYVAISGENIDGNIYAEDAIKKGASCCILDNLDYIDTKKYKDKTIIKVDNTIECLQELAKLKRSKYNIPVIAVTGSVGKTSTKDIIAEVVKGKYNTLKTEGNLNNHIGLPLTILRLKDEEALVVEMGMNHKNEISVLTNIAKPTISVITNIGTAHIGNLGSRENILKAKLEILEGMEKHSTLIINNDNDLLHKELPKLEKDYNVITVGINNNSTYLAKNIKEYPFNSKFQIENNDIEINVGGLPFIYNSLVAYAVGKCLNIDNDKIKDAIYNFKLSPHRQELITNKTGTTIIDDTYNANIDSMLAAIKILGQVKNKRKIALLADMLELGDYEEELHRKVGKEVTDNNIDILITVGPLANKYIKAEAIKNNMDEHCIYSFNSANDSVEFLNKLLKSNDIILLKGSNSMHLTNIVEKIK